MATSRKDMRRIDLVIPWADQTPKKKEDMASTYSNDHIAHGGYVYAKQVRFFVQYSLRLDTINSTLFLNTEMFGDLYQNDWMTWMAESPEQKKTSSTPAYLAVFMSLLAVVVLLMDGDSDYFQTYLPLFLPPTQKAAGTVAPSSTPST
ncbi:hypothetical protein LOZ58_004147 [Ophidiomyces ophidiicola]|nr:hypothetical protein LOZ58_004147 [Ophidiomyces ophidiicola]